MSESLLTKYRPKTWDGVVGHESEIQALRVLAENRQVRSFFLVGPSGIGKTTIARILAHGLGADDSIDSLLEFDAATYTGVDAMREVMEMVRVGTFSGANKVVIIDEAHMLSTSAWSSMLKTIEEPPPGVYMIFCTTELSKIPNNINTRSTILTLREVSVSKIVRLLEHVVEKEKYKVPEEVVEYIADTCGGSPRRALSNLALCLTCGTVDEAEALVEHIDGGGKDEVSKMCQRLLRGSLTWSNVTKFFDGVKGSDPESIRLSMCAYLSKVVRHERNEEKVVNGLAALAALKEPCWRNQWAPLVLGFGGLVFGEEEE